MHVRQRGKRKKKKAQFDGRGEEREAAAAAEERAFMKETDKRIAGGLEAAFSFVYAFRERESER